ncbi:HAD-IIIA family hydrolase, partial [Flavobacteriaceae bacterium]|nr:HAD-IIIA family hydrolase [Flavobacteriaceae bacterium]
RFLAKGYLLFLHTNQSGIGRGYYKMEDVINCNNQMIKLLDMNSKVFKEICIAGDYPPEKNSYRKPSIRFGKEIITKYKIQSDELIYIGDNTSDMETAFKLNCKAYGINFNDKVQLLDKKNIAEKFNYKVYGSLSEIENDVINNDI